MAPSAVYNNPIVPNGFEPSVKDVKAVCSPADEIEENAETLPLHPLGIKPSGNQYTSSTNAKYSMGTFRHLPDEMIVVLLEFMDSKKLRMLGATCRAMYAFCAAEELWKQLFIDARVPSPFTWQGTWRSTHLNLPPKITQGQIRIPDMFSDTLYRPFLCAHTSLSPFVSGISPSNTIPSRPNLCPEEFFENWHDRPFMLTEPVKKWPIYKSWDADILRQKYGDVKFRAEAVDWDLETYISYMRNTTDESPVYLFDRSFVESMKLNVPEASAFPREQTASGNTEDSTSYDYEMPSCFSQDLFSMLGNERPDSRWLIIGPARSGSTFHKDPNATSAWNAVLRGRKYWLMFHPSVATPPGVFVSDDASEVTSPLSIAEWLLGFHAEARKMYGHGAQKDGVALMQEGICGPGEILYVPSGWWHLVVNLDESIAVTGNFVAPGKGLVNTLGFMRDSKGDQISGFKCDLEDPYGLFVARLREAGMGESVDEALQTLDEKAKGKKRKWESVVETNEEPGAGFSFGFGGDDDVEIP